ncbi:MAG TPA: hypothetical protein VKE96_00065 [Vicinamibacterales bacterium]|nr:hypothetical protein [Vicinamibacterales bacterium]
MHRNRQIRLILKHGSHNSERTSTKSPEPSRTSSSPPQLFCDSTPSAVWTYLRLAQAVVLKADPQTLELAIQHTASLLKQADFLAECAGQVCGQPVPEQIAAEVEVELASGDLTTIDQIIEKRLTLLARLERLTKRRA